MGLTSLQVCMDSSEWLHQGNVSEENREMGSSPMTPPSDQEDILACSGPLIERRLIRPQHEQALKCPRCESTHTKFCYYNNYSLSQPRYFCKTCRRYWTKGGTLRNIPVGGGCRKNKKVSSSSKKSSSNDLHNQQPVAMPVDLLVHQNNFTGLSCYNNNNNNSFNTQCGDSTDLQLAFPHDQIHFPALNSNGLFGNIQNSAFLLENSAPMEFMENKYEALLGSHGFLANADSLRGIHDGFHGVLPPFEMHTLDQHNGVHNPISGTVLESCQRMMLPYDNNHSHEMDVKPINSSKILALEWPDHQQAACNSDAGIAYHGGGAGPWTGLMNAYGSSNTLV